jgi:AcrR family transcriptional regulator
MAGTKEKILDTALRLFNSQGIEQTTIRHIAQEMGISHGNLQYHYANTDLIIRALYDRLWEGFERMMQAAPQQVKGGMPGFRQSIAVVFKHIYNYRFIYLHFVEIGHRIPDIVTHYRKNFKNREQQFLSIFKQMQEAGIMRKDIPDKILRYLVHQLFIVCDFWLSSNEITLQLNEKKSLAYYEELFFSMFYPYCTSKGLKSLGIPT